MHVYQAFINVYTWNLQAFYNSATFIIAPERELFLNNFFLSKSALCEFNLAKCVSAKFEVKEKESPSMPIAFNSKKKMIKDLNK